MRKQSALLLFILILLSSCEESPAATAVPPTTVPPTTVPPTATPEPAEPTPSPGPLLDSGVVISEMLPGVPGNNNHEFIELYNAGTEPVSLADWSLWFRLADNQDEQLIFAWDAGDVPPLGHYLLVREGETFDLNGDAIFTTPLLTQKGGLALRDADGNDVDVLGWGDAPDGFFAGTAVPAPEDGASLERLPGGAAGNGQFSGDNSLDFRQNPNPSPQNSGSPLTPAPAEQLLIYLDMPAEVEPGAEFTAEVTVGNVSETAVSQVTAVIPISDSFVVQELPPGAAFDAGRITWSIGQIPANGSLSASITLQSPYTYIDAIFGSYYIEAQGRLRSYGPPQIVSVAGGSIPIGTARGLVGSTVTVEGVATMYTGGFFAGSTGTKFYMQDETGGVQVYVPGGIDDIHVNLGDTVRVTGQIQLYRDSIELVPLDFANDIEMVETGGEPLEPLPVDMAALLSDGSILGQLVTIEGTATRIEEFSYSYEMDIADDAGNTILLYIDKLTEMSVEPFDVGQPYRVTGINEFYNGQHQLYPRIQSDISPIYPPALLLDLSAPNSVAVGEMMTVTVTAVNHTTAPLTNLQIRTNPPQGAALDEILDGGILESGTIFWNIAELAGDGGTVSVSYRVTADMAEGGQITIAPAEATADQWPEPATTDAFLTFVGVGVPIWAIQGDGMQSPYVRSEATTVGVVTAVFPDLGGFWLQTLDPDGNPATSDGLFVLLDEAGVDVAEGDLLQITGRVREISGQTTLDPQTPEDIVELGTDYTGAVEPVAYDPPQDVAEALAYNESLEGMLVVVDTAVAVAPTTQYGEYALVADKWGVDSVRRTDAVGYLIQVDDGSSVAHQDASTLPYTVTKGDEVTNLVGPLAFTFDNYKIEPIAVPEIVVGERPLPQLAEAGPDQFSIATFNTENFFDDRDPNPDDPPRPTAEEYALKLHKVAEAIVAMGAPTIVGLQEVENIEVLEALVAQEELVAYGYEPYLIEGFDSRGIDVGYIVRGDRAAVESVESYPAPDELTSRPPLAIQVTVHLEGGDQTVYVLNNHFTSLSAGEEATEPIRTAQAAWNVSVMEQIQVDDPAAQFVVLGDLNSFYQTLPIDTLQEGGLRHVYEWFGDAPLPYTYIFEGRTQTLDHILMSDSLFGHLASVRTAPIDADYPIPNPDDATARRVSDHDPLIAVFSFGN
ncbi:MAG: lamin tail domain-containing protein [Ardenticatenaceae bacterium]|nr:lamin tail domain-containing protein [Ardenticatenaceae bacterium]MCB9444736.1 lamin tail domain-containing protein [Ardenticatenaceae bacterium]